MNNSTVNAVLLNKKNILTKKNLHNQKKKMYLCSRFFELSKTNIGNNNRCLMNIEKHV